MSNRRDELAANLNTMGVAADNTETLKSLIPKVLDISGSTDPLDPTEVYKTTRPADWLVMPSVTENEIYLLFHVAPPAENYVAFTVSCTGSYTVDYGTVANGTFVAAGSETISSGAAYEGTFYYDDWADDTSDGKRQVMLRITGTDIKTFAPAIHTARNYSDFRSWDIVEFTGNLPSCTACMVGNDTTLSALQQLRYFTLEGTNRITNFDSMFSDCYSLTAIPALDTSSGTSFNNMFSYCYSLTATPALDTSNGTSFDDMFSVCYSLTAIPALDTSNGTSFNNMFSYCYSLTAIPALDTSNGTSFNYMFYYCISLTAIPELDTSKGTSFNYMFSYCYSLSTTPALDTSNGTSFNYMFYRCYSLTAIPELDTSKGASFNHMFNGCSSLSTIPALDTSKVSSATTPFTNCYSLKNITFSGTNTTWPAALDLGNSSLTATAVEALFNSLPTITTSRAITLTNTPAALALTSEQIAIATTKNWTVTL